jgi:hypothetical protein
MRRRAYAALLLAVLFLAGCANIPEESTPHAVRDEQQPATGEAAEAPPTANLNPFDLVREFVRRSGNPDTARQYLKTRGQANWGGDYKPTIIDDTFGTVPNQNSDVQAGEDQGAAGDTRVTVMLRVTVLGRFGPDNAFVPMIGENQFRVGVVREKGQWRIDEPPQGVYVPLSDFNASYRPVTVYFFDPDLRITVPDQRYVAAKPAEGLPGRVISALLSGPSDAMRHSLMSPLTGVATRTNVVEDADGTLVVDLVPLGDKTEEERELIAAQIVLTLRDVTTYSRLRIKGDGQDLIPGHGDWRPTDIKQYDALTKPSSDQPGLVSSGGRLYTLSDGKPVPGPAGNGTYNVVSAAQSIDGGQLAVVTAVGDRLRLRVGRYGEALQEISRLDATTMTRPTWRVSTVEGQDPNEVWTVEDGNVVRVVRSGSGVWTPVEVNASALQDFGPIREFRLSRDGTRAAMVMTSGKLVVAAVVRDKDSVSLANPRTLQQRLITNAVGVDWLNQHTLVVVTGQSDLPVIRVPVDGLTIDAYDSSNLQFPMHAVTAAPERDVVVTDNAAVLVAPGVGQIWRQLQNGQGATAIPFYPG